MMKRTYKSKYNKQGDWWTHSYIGMEICRSIGMKDKNGKGIFENDKVLFRNEPGIIMFNTEYFRYEISIDRVTDPHKKCIPLHSYYSKEIEVVGNIYDKMVK